MKKALTHLVSLLSVLAVFSCGDAIEIPDVTPPEQKPDDPSEGENPLVGDVVFTATAENLPDGSAVQWRKGDQISLFDGISVQTLTNTAENGIVAKFPVTLTGKETGFMALSPVSSEARISAGAVSMTLPAVQKADEAVPAWRVAKSMGKTLFFRNLLATVTFTVAYDGVTKVRLQTAGGEKISGDIRIDYSGETPVATATEDYVEVTGDFVQGETYSVSILPGKLSGFSVTALTGEEETAHTGGGAITLTPGATASLEPLGQDIPTYRITNLWVYGGTGPEYNGDKVIDILTKPTYFNDEDGRGIEAVKDNYFELRPDGTFMNWAGEDGRNWWYVYSGAVNPSNRKDLDLKAFYEVLPRGEGTYAVDGANITFTTPDGVTTSGLFVPPGTYTLRGTRAVTISEGHIALQFTITGGKDDWNNNYTDYDVIASHPRILFIEVEQMPPGFVTPEASRKTDTEFEFVPLDDLFDWNSLPGKWNVLGGNSSPFGLFVLGGSGNDPGFVSPIDKSWDWNDSIWRESDNELIITVTSMSGTEVKGTTNWWAGTDGKFWDYTWKKTGEDLSRFYDKIPKGEKEFTFNMKTLEITLGNGEKAKFLIPGTHTFTGTSAISFSKSIEVPTGCFALDFHLMDPIPKTSDQYTDVDRFVNAPLEYIMIFEKP